MTLTNHNRQAGIFSSIFTTI